MANGLTEVARVAIHGPDERNQLSYPIGCRRITTQRRRSIRAECSASARNNSEAYSRRTQGENAEGLKASFLRLSFGTHQCGREFVRPTVPCPTPPPSSPAPPANSHHRIKGLAVALGEVWKRRNQ